MPSTVKPSSRCSRRKASIAGASVRHGLHHEAQKLTSTHSPRWSAIESSPSAAETGQSRFGDRVTHRSRLSAPLAEQAEAEQGDDRHGPEAASQWKSPGSSSAQG